MLRHAPDRFGLSLDAGGWASTTAVLDALAHGGHPLTRRELAALVAGSDKQRFALDEVADRIRANQGHSIDVDLGLVPAAPPATLYHGTPSRNLASILADGLHKGSRHAVHLSPDEQTARAVGARRGKHVVLAVDAAAMHHGGHVFTVSANGVWLTESVPPQHLRVVDPA